MSPHRTVSHRTALHRTATDTSPLGHTPQDRHALELKIYRQRVKHLLFEHHAAQAALKVEREGALRAQVLSGLCLCL